MVKELIFKEWKERLHLIIFALAIMLIFALVIILYSSKQSLIELMTSAMALIFLPFFSLLLGSSSFYAEFKDNAWAYLFSRPIKKWKIWLIKLFALSAVLILVFLVFFFIGIVFPLIKKFLFSNILPSYIYDHISVLTVGIVFSVMLFIISFATSFLSAKQFQVIFLALLTFFGLYFVLYIYYYQVLQLVFPYYLNLEGISLFIGLSFILASLLAFTKSDFSQLKRKTAHFSKFVLFFLIVSLVISTAWSWLNKDFVGPGKYVRIFRSDKGDVFFISPQGIFKYLADEDEVQKVGKNVRLSNAFSISVNGGKVAFFNFRGWRGSREELWIMNIDGLQAKRLASNRKKEEPLFYKRYFSSCYVFPDGNRVSFIARPLSEKNKGEYPTLCWIKADSSGLRCMPLQPPFSLKGIIFPIAWTEFGDNLILRQMWPPMSKNPLDKIFMLNIENRNIQVLAEDIKSHNLSPQQDLLALCTRESNEQKDILYILDLKTQEKKEVLMDDHIFGVRWSPQGDKLAFLIKQDNSRFVMAIYSISDQKVVASKDLILQETPFYFPELDWVYEGTKLILKEMIGKEVSLKILSSDLIEEKKTKIPESIDWSFYLSGVDQKALIDDGKNKTLWRLDLERLDWRQIF